MVSGVQLLNSPAKATLFAPASSKRKFADSPRAAVVIAMIVTKANQLTTRTARRELVPFTCASFPDLRGNCKPGAELSAKAVFKPTKDFHTARPTLFSAKQNLGSDSRAGAEPARQIPRERCPAGARTPARAGVNVVPVSARVKTKLGRGGSYED